MGERRGRTSEFRPRRFRRYPDYRDSGVEWLGEIPAHWEIRRADRRLTSLKHPVVPSEIRGQDVFHYSIPNVQQFGSGVIEPSATIDSSKAAIDRPVLLVSKLNPRKGTLALAKPHPALMTLASSEFIVMEPKGCVLEFARYFYRSEHVRLALSARVESATRSHQRCSPDDISKLPISWPSKPEQTTIATFLDRETAKIDELVAKQERLIELLQEKRTALITSAVTRGLDPNVPMKDSGVEWLGEIPAHWEVKRLKHVVPGITVGIVVTPSKYYVDEGIPCLRSLNVSGGAIDTNDLVFISDSANELHRKSRIFSGDVVVVRTGQAGTAAVVPKGLDGTNCIDLLIVRRSDQVLSRFVYFYLNSHPAMSQAIEQSVGAIQAHYNTSTLAQLVVPKISMDEQSRMVLQLDAATRQIDQLIAKVQKALDHLKEYRTALISAAVTGKIDVRNEAA